MLLRDSTSYRRSWSLQAQRAHILVVHDILQVIAKYVIKDFYAVTLNPTRTAYLTSSSISPSLMNPSLLTSAWWRARLARMPGIIEPRYAKAFFSSSLLSWLSLLASYFLKMFLSWLSDGGRIIFWGSILWTTIARTIFMWRLGGWRTLGKFFKNLLMLFEFGVLKPWGIYNEPRLCFSTCYLFQVFFIEKCHCRCACDRWVGQAWPNIFDCK